MLKEIDSKLGFGPMSPEAVEAIIKASSILKKSFMLISTKNQIDWNGGYVNKWTTEQYVNYVNKIKKRYKNSKIFLCRDHCGPGFKNNSVEDVYNTVFDDIDNGFNLIHIDFSKVSVDKKIVLEESIKIINSILKKNNEIKIEIGTEENLGEIKKDITGIKKEFFFIKEVVKPEFFVVQTGSLVKEIYQLGYFNKPFVNEVHDFLLENNVKLKEHNSDYLNFKQISGRCGVVDALNIAPQLGIIQTQVVLNEALLYGIDIKPFLECSYKSNKWLKWLYTSNRNDKLLCSILAGHYNFTSDEYKSMVFKINKYTDIRGTIIEKILKLVTYYSEAFN